ncbi:GGDEF domain-containing protein [Kineosporia sp. NBRC 101731]|uniref:GGDEF domain-containing protein n=1 Tax=Kineosporia sp. NBRC 101731 TaxID=3032199 RepID=UPI0024A055D0|nr:GGDEF domain-containing protein [Kineosporia sp. NBRC 101731]GLY28158.1 hypothetical protein Kisp02_15230 [Kineosporia sp. NBRC 101731]
MDREDTGEHACLRRARLVERIGSELLRTAATDASRIRLAGWETTRDLVEMTPGLRAVRLAKTADGFGLGPWLGEFPQNPPAVTTPPDAGADVPAVHDVLNAAAGEPCDWTMITYESVAPEVTLALGAPGRLDPEVLVTARSILNHVMLAYRNSRLHEELRESVRTDALTRLATRWVFTEVLATILEVPSPGHLSLLLIDIDDFVAVNEAYGHAGGDDLLVSVAEMLRRVVPDNDIIARMGADEFAVLLPGIDLTSAEKFARQIVSAFSTLLVDGAGTQSVSAGIGVVAIAPDADVQTVLVRAGVALNAAKARGKGQVESWRPALQHEPSAARSRL